MHIETVTAATFEQVLPLIADYQRFYEATPYEDRNRKHFAKLLEDHDLGIQFVALDDAGRALGFATLYFPLGSVSARVNCLMNDLYTVPDARGQGIGRAPILHCLAYARGHGSTSIFSQTAQSNARAQSLYHG